ncbi:MAG: Rrf2 family transcriptional regulator [Oscillospiraceae bacterium]|nr:Rrf2 family transcriptional regulator [Oscillospiraceae bacterium]
MRISTKVEYGLVALTDIAFYSEKNVVSTADIAKRQNISQKYLEQILMRLKQAGLLKATKGAGGGYSLSRSADKILMTDVLDALDNSLLADNEHYEDDRLSELKESANVCFWNKINEQLRRFTDNMTLRDFMSLCSEHKQSVWDLYVI